MLVSVLISVHPYQKHLVGSGPSILVLCLQLQSPKREGPSSFKSGTEHLIQRRELHKDLGEQGNLVSMVTKPKAVVWKERYLHDKQFIWVKKKFWPLCRSHVSNQSEEKYLTPMMKVIIFDSSVNCLFYTIIVNKNHVQLWILIS